jgi:signal transduction histidine kinase
MSSSDLVFLISLAAFVGIGTLALFLFTKTERVRELELSLLKLKKSFDRLDEQAKLIVKTDLELNKAQEESERRLKALDALQKTSRLISTTLDEKEIFHRINQSLLNELGFDKNLVILAEPDKGLQTKVSLGFEPHEIPYVLSSFAKDTHLREILDEGNTFSSINIPDLRRDAIRRIFDMEHFILSPILTQSGTIGYVFVGNRSHASPITEGDEEPIGILANQIGQALENARLFEEVYRSQQALETKIQERTRELESALNHVQAVSKAKSDFISAVSHELRTPLTSIKGYAAILMAGKLGDVPEAVHQRLEKINTHSDNLVQLINNLLDISRIESGRTTMNMTRCGLKKIIDNVNDLLAPQMKEKNIRWTEEYDEKIPELYLDASQAERIFINLVGNATKFTPKGGSITVRADWIPDKNHVKIEVSDTGIGISEDNLARLFNEFYRVDNEINQNAKGTGLGLSLAKKIAEAHGGEMWATSRMGQGSTFHFTLPLREPPKTEKPGAPPPLSTDS